jgi:hypothetical protein
MPVLSITASSVATTGEYEQKTAGATITAGQALYYDASTNRMKLADADSSSTTRVFYGIALNAASTGQPVFVQRTGSITIGATLIPGMQYVLSNTAGGIMPISDLISGDYFVPIGTATSASVLLLNPNQNAIVATTQPGYLTQETVWDVVSGPADVDTTAVTGDTLDMGAGPDYEGVTFFAHWGTITDGTTGLKAQQGAASDMNDAADLLGTSVTGSVSDKLTILEIVKPLERYVRCIALRGGSTGAVLNSIIACRYRAIPGNLPTSQSSDVGAIERHLSPAEGTA